MNSRQRFIFISREHSVTIVDKANRKALVVLNKSDDGKATESDGDSGKDPVAINRGYKVTVLKQVREIVRKHIGGRLPHDDWKFGLGEIDAPSLTLSPGDPLPSDLMQKNHLWRQQIVSSVSEERIGHFVVYAYMEEEVCTELSSSFKTIKRRIDKIAEDGSLQPIIERSDKHGKKMRKSALPNMIIKGDSRHLSRKIKAEEIDMIFTSPPYFDARLMYAEYASYEEYLKMLTDVFVECEKVLHEGRFIIVNVSPVIVPRKNRASASTRVPIPFDVAKILGEAGFEFVDDIQWVKPSGAAGHRGRRFAADRNPMQYKTVPVTENILVYRKKSTLLIDWFIRNHHDLKKVKASRIEDGYEATNLWEIQPANDPIHKAVFPLELAEKVVQYYSFEDDVVLDPFAGVGTTGKAAARLNRRFVMVELDDEDHGKKEKKSYVEAMLKRLEDWGVDPENVERQDWTDQSQ
jgi:DNA modification methylase